jgi:rhodanese-related sulfurtransferase
VNPSYRYLAVGALLLGLLALFVRNPKESRQAIVDVQELVRIIEREEDHLTVDELAAMLMEGKLRLRILDLRNSTSYMEYHIPTAERIGISRLMNEQLSPVDTTVLYSDGGIHAAQAWMLLAAKGHKNVFTLRGGLNEWKDKVVFPRDDQQVSREARAKLSTRAQFFSGELLDRKQSVGKPRTSRPIPLQKKMQKEVEKAREVC